MIVVDSSVWIAKLRGRPDAAIAKLEAIEDTRQIIVPEVVLLEILQGAPSEAVAAEIDRELRTFHIVEIMSIRLARQAAANYRLLRRRGITVRGPFDMAIGTWCIENDAALLQNDRDFGAMAEHLGLQLA